MPSGSILLGINVLYRQHIAGRTLIWIKAIDPETPQQWLYHRTMGGILR
ncbi:MAG: hypothetical protein ABJH45_12395 [Paracoccaceae bacterium]